MIISTTPQNTPEWIEERRSKITGSKLKDIITKRGTSKKIGYYQLIADKLGLPADEELPMDRGHRLESEAIAEFEMRNALTTKRVGLCTADFNSDIAVSPDALIESNGKYTEAIEIKCLSSARHIQALLEQKIPDDYEYQVLQYFVVNPDLQVLHFVFFDPRIISNPYICFDIRREDKAQEIEELREYEINLTQEINDIVSQLAF